ncbi:MAG: hypothetical protein JO054_01815, partial [Actinobacteria bacterium]|nr:hypothetical protein [Actinomycetota bacterium]
MVLGIALLTLAGCGARWSASERAAVIANHFGPRNGAVRAGSSTAASTDASTDTVGAGAADNAGPTAAGGPVAATKADAVKTATGQQAARGAQPCAAHSDAP